MSETAPLESDRALMAQVARLYFERDIPRTQIAELLGLSRFKVGRIIARARDEGVVTITINDQGLPDARLSQLLREKLGLQECVVVRSHGTPEAVRQQLGAAASDLIAGSLREGEVLGVTWGRSIAATVTHLGVLPTLTVVQLTGFVAGERGASPVELVRDAVERSGGVVHPIFAPLVVQDFATAQSLRRHPDLHSALRLYDSVTAAVLSVGSWDPAISQVRDVLDDEDVERFQELGCVADTAGILLRADGTLVDTEFQRRCVAISADALRAVPRKIAVAGGAGKATAVGAAVAAGFVTSLVTDHELAEAVLAS